MYKPRFFPYRKENVKKARHLRTNMTAPEKRLWYRYLSKHRKRFLRQHPIDNYILDFYSPRAKLVIEVDGESHYSARAQKYDEIRTESLESHGLRVIRFTNYEVMSNLEGVCEVIEEVIENPLAFPLYLKGDL